MLKLDSDADSHSKFTHQLHRMVEREILGLNKKRGMAKKRRQELPLLLLHFEQLIWQNSDSFPAEGISAVEPLLQQTKSLLLGKYFQLFCTITV
jgi:hypothetical protein